MGYDSNSEMAHPSDEAYMAGTTDARRGISHENARRAAKSFEYPGDYMDGYYDAKHDE